MVQSFAGEHIEQGTKNKRAGSLYYSQGQRRELRREENHDASSQSRTVSLLRAKRSEVDLSGTWTEVAEPMSEVPTTGLEGTLVDVIE